MVYNANKNSIFIYFKHGVPQGYVSRPLPFITYINNLIEDIHFICNIECIDNATFITFKAVSKNQNRLKNRSSMVNYIN